jgi:hypothetical protein
MVARWPITEAAMLRSVSKDFLSYFVLRHYKVARSNCALVCSFLSSRVQGKF